MFVVGADGCKIGWFAIKLYENIEWEINVYKNIYSLWDECKDASLILLDIPIGLNERGSMERLCDIEARSLLGSKRGSSVFRVPCRKTLNADSYREAKEINYELSGKKITQQSWGIISKIKEVDDLLQKNNNAKTLIREIHPELCFWALAGRRPMVFNKKDERGYQERIQVLKNAFPRSDEVIKVSLLNHFRKDVARDDILDALSAAVTAQNGSEELISIPKIPQFDSKGLRMEMVYKIAH